MRGLFALFSCILLFSCGKALPELDNFDTETWKSDRNACLDKRLSMKKILLEQKDKLLALKETQIVTLLGRPDNNELYERNQKFYYYYLTPAPVCGQPSETTLQLEIRFNALGYSKEIYIK